MDGPKWRRRKDARPAEIVDAAIGVFVDRGFSGTKLSDVAKKAGVAKGTVYLYFETKEDLFRAAARQALAPTLAAVEMAAARHLGSVTELVPMLMGRAADRLGDGRIPGIARMVLSESKSFPDLARIWHDEVVAKVILLLSELIERAQERGEVRPGDASLYAMSILGPMVLGLLFHEVFGSFSNLAPDLDALAVQHTDAIFRGMLESSPRTS